MVGQTRASCSSPQPLNHAIMSDIGLTCPSVWPCQSSGVAVRLPRASPRKAHGPLAIPARLQWPTKLRRDHRRSLCRQQPVFNASVVPCFGRDVIEFSSAHHIARRRARQGLRRWPPTRRCTAAIVPDSAALASSRASHHCQNAITASIADRCSCHRRPRAYVQHRRVAEAKPKKSARRRAKRSVRDKLKVSMMWPERNCRCCHTSKPRAGDRPLWQLHRRCARPAPAHDHMDPAGRWSEHSLA